MKLSRIKKRKLYVIRDSRGRFRKWSRTKRFRFSLEEQRALKKEYQREIKLQQYLNPLKAQKYSDKNLLEKTALSNVDYVAMKKPLKSYSGFLVLKVRFWSKPPRQFAVHEGRSKRHYFPSEYNSAFREALRGAFAGLPFSPEDYIIMAQWYTYYLKKGKY